MKFNFENYAITFLIAILSSILTTYTYDKNFRFFNSGKEKYEIENAAPKVFISKLEEIVPNSVSDKIFSAEIKSVAVSLNEGEKEEFVFSFHQLDAIPETSKFLDWGIRIYNPTNDGISLEAFYGKHGEVISLANFNHRHIDPLNSVVFLFSLRDKPKKITSLFKSYRLTYTFDTEKNYISPTAKRIG